jgi:hypothetical protein
MKSLVAFLLVLTISVFPQDYKKVKIFINNNFDFERLVTLSLDLEHSAIDKEGGRILFVDESEFSSLQQSGLAYEILIDDWHTYYNSLPKLNEGEKRFIKNESEMKFGVSGFKFGSMGGYYTFDEIIADLDTMFQLYPNLITEKYSIGTSREGRTIWAVKMSDNPNINEDEPAVGFDALIHAREPQSMATLMYFMWYLLENYGTDPEVTYLINNREIHCVPCFNPDGYEYNRQTDPNGGGMWRKNRRDNGGGVFGVDLNRNFGYMWGYDDIGSSPDSTSNMYRGPFAFSEPEAQAVRDLAILKNYGTHFNMHSYRDAYLYPWGYIDQESPDSLMYREFAYDMSKYNDYEYGTTMQILGYLSNGNMKDWMYGEQEDKEKIISYVVEYGNSSDWFWPQQNRIFPIAQINVKPNIYNAFVAGEYVKLLNPNFNKEYFLPGYFVDLTPEFKNKGLVSAYNLSFELSSLSGYATINTGNTSLDSIEARSSATIDSTLSFTISNSAPIEEEIPLVFTTHSNGHFMSADTVTIIIGFPVMIFADTTNDPNELWTITATPSNPKWDSTTATYHSTPTSFTDSKDGNYSNNATVTMTLTDPLDLILTGYTNPNPRLIFWTKFDIEPDYDYGQVEASTDNGNNWTPLEGLYTEPGVQPIQPVGEPVYDGVIRNWVREDISLADYLSDQFKIRFQLNTDAVESKDGWYIDDIEIFIYTITSVQESDEIILSYALEQNYPNPFNPTTQIKFTIPEAGITTLKVYDILGSEVATLINEERKAGKYKVEFDAANLPAGRQSLPSGVYFYQLRVYPAGGGAGFIQTKKMVLIK